MRRLTIVSTAVIAAACATRSPDQGGLERLDPKADSEGGVDPLERGADHDDDAPAGFLKLANRGLALVVYYAKDPTSGGWIDPDSLEGVLARDLEGTYRTKVASHRRIGTFRGFDLELVKDLALAGADDVVVLEVGEEGQALAGRVLVQALAGQAPIVREEIRSSGAKDGFVAQDLAKKAWTAVRRTFVDPAAGPPLDGVTAADLLVTQNRCDLAIPVYEKYLPSLRASGTVSDAKRGADGEAKLKACARALELARLRAEDQKAHFRLDLDVEGLAPRLREAASRALPGSRIEAQIKAIADKPAKVVIRPDGVRVEVRWNPDWYSKKTAKRQRYIKSQRPLYLDPFAGLMGSLLDLRDKIAAKLPPYDAKAVNELPTTIRMTKLEGDWVDIDYAEREGNLLFTDSLRVKVAGRDQMTVRTTQPSELRNEIFLLGPPEQLDGRPTDFGVLYEFFSFPP